MVKEWQLLAQTPGPPPKASVPCLLFMPVTRKAGLCSGVWQAGSSGLSVPTYYMCSINVG